MGSLVLGDEVTACFLVVAGPKFNVPFLLTVVDVAEDNFDEAVVDLVMLSTRVGEAVDLALLLKGFEGAADLVVALDVKCLALEIVELLISVAAGRFIDEVSRKITFEFFKIPHLIRSSMASLGASLHAL